METETIIKPFLLFSLHLPTVPVHLTFFGSIISQGKRETPLSVRKAPLIITRFVPEGDFAKIGKLVS